MNIHKYVSNDQSIAGPKKSLMALDCKMVFQDLVGGIINNKRTGRRRTAKHKSKQWTAVPWLGYPDGRDTGTQQRNQLLKGDGACVRSVPDGRIWADHDAPLLIYRGCPCDSFIPRSRGRKYRPDTPYRPIPFGIIEKCILDFPSTNSCLGPFAPPQTI